jgi:hypothetical protein
MSADKLIEDRLAAVLGHLATPAHKDLVSIVRDMVLRETAEELAKDAARFDFKMVVKNGTYIAATYIDANTKHPFGIFTPHVSAETIDTLQQFISVLHQVDKMSAGEANMGEIYIGECEEYAYDGPRENSEAIIPQSIYVRLNNVAIRIVFNDERIPVRNATGDNVLYRSGEYYQMCFTYGNFTSHDVVTKMRLDNLIESMGQLRDIHVCMFEFIKQRGGIKN